MSLVFRAPGVIASPEFRIVPAVTPAAAHEIVPARTVARVGQPIASIPTPVGNPVDVISPPPLISQGNGYTYARFDGVDDVIRLSATPAISYPNFTAFVVCRLVDLAGTIFYGMPPGGTRSDLSVISGVLSFVADAGQVATHPWEPDNDMHVFSVAQASGAVTIGVDGVEQTTTVTPAAITSFTLGRKRGGGYTQYDVADARLMSRTLTASERAGIVTNLAAAYGIAL